MYCNLWYQQLAAPLWHQQLAYQFSHFSKLHVFGAHCHRFHSGIRERDFSRRVRRRATRVFDRVAVAVELRKLLPIVVSPY